MVCVCSFLHVWEWSTSASIIILLVFKSIFPCFMEHTKLSTAAYITLCCRVWSWSHWTLWISPVCLSGRTPCFKCVYAVPLRKCSVQWLSEILISYLWRRGSVAAYWVSLWSNTDGLVQGSLKGTQGKMLCFCLFLPSLCAFLLF